MHRIVCFGEIMLRLNPEGYLRIPQADKLMASYAGGEANVSVSLASYGGMQPLLRKFLHIVWGRVQ